MAPIFSSDLLAELLARCDLRDQTEAPRLMNTGVMRAFVIFTIAHIVGEVEII
ncbi:hypothetical protein HMPREF3192_00383 [Atopobium deltae]|uniref:Uncharacterized protein n=1 Tax=Atopobium deltae TaxID=1393034 RepID=A0A133XWJ0_9ACTN|nr:hypothetical protein HMPREF3192_00383 [Atopobium deltae]